MVTRHSPCVGICTLEGTLDICLGCGRSRDEIAQWMVLNEQQRDMVWLELPARLATLNVGVRLLPWTPEEILGFIAKSLNERLGTWSLGRTGEAAWFPPSLPEPLLIEVGGSSVVARAKTAAFKMTVSDKVRAFGIARSRRVALALPKARAVVVGAPPTERLETDSGAIDEDRRSEVILHLGGDDQNIRWSVRSGDTKLIDWLKTFAGRRPSDLKHILASEGDVPGIAFVCETAIARVEFYSSSWHEPPEAAAIAPPDAGQNDGTSATLPTYATEVATFHPQIWPDS